MEEKKRKERKDQEIQGRWLTRQLEEQGELMWSK
jgi:hypothetical protein